MNRTQMLFLPICFRDGYESGGKCSAMFCILLFENMHNYVFKIFKIMYFLREKTRDG